MAHPKPELECLVAKHNSPFSTRKAEHLRKIQYKGLATRFLGLQDSMGSEIRDGEWLKVKLCEHLGWDAFAMEGVVSAINSAESPSEVNEIITNYMDNDSKARSLVEQFLSFRDGVFDQVEATSANFSQQKVQKKEKNVSNYGTQKSSGYEQSSGPAQRNPTPNRSRGGASGSGSAAQNWKEYTKSRTEDLSYISGKDNPKKKGKNAPKKMMESNRRPQTPPRTAQMGLSNGLNSGYTVSDAIRRVQGESQNSGQSKGSHKKSGQNSGGRAEKSKKKKEKMSGSHASQLQLPQASRLQKKVANCLGCGKVYDCRKVTDEIYSFLESGGFCNFCGKQVNLTFDSPGHSSSFPNETDSTQNEGKNEKNAENAEKMAKNGSEIEIEEGEVDGEQSDVQKAVEFKNRLVDYDRNAAKRTVVIDDQADFFEIDSNVWLSEQERKELRDRSAHEKELAEQKNRKVKYTIDLVGRKVMVAEEADISNEGKKIAEMALDAAKSTSKEVQQGGGSGANEAIETAKRLGANLVQQGGQILKEMKASPNPDIAMPAPLFMPKKGKKSKKKGAEKPEKSARDRWARGYGARLQHEDIFAGFEDESNIEVLYEDLAMIDEAQLDEGPFDICIDNKENEEMLPAIEMPERSEVKISANTRLSTMILPSSAQSPSTNANKGTPSKVGIGSLPEGMVLLKGWLSLEQQAKIVEDVRKLGLGPGGFYTPGYTGGAQMKLKMMCLGKHWEPRDRKYQDTRSSYDGATPPAIPQFFKDLVQNCVKDAAGVWGRSFPRIDPNVCLCNFYSKDSSLGLHQDKEEGPESCYKKRIPVVSFSIGATGEFVFSNTKNLNDAYYVDLESGDALVFGGPSRMIYHGVPKIQPETMPKKLVDKTRMRQGRLNLTFRQYIPSPEEFGN